MTEKHLSKIERLKSRSVVQGGMGAGVSLAKKGNEDGLVRVVSMNGGLGISSGTALDLIMVRKLQNGDKDGSVRRALKEFPNQEIVGQIIDKYFIDGGRDKGMDYSRLPFPRFEQEGKILNLKSRMLEELVVIGNFVEVYLAKEGHDNPVGINYLHKIQWPLMPAIYGAMLANVDGVFIGAGFPRRIPGVLDAFSRGEGASMPIPVSGGNDYSIRFNPSDILNCGELEIPAFVGIVGNHLGIRGLPDANGFVFEGYPAGGHVIPARSRELTVRGEPAYGPKDEMNFRLLEKLIRENTEANGGVRPPYWFAGGYARKLDLAIKQGAVGVQVGTAFGLSKNSNIYNELRLQSLGKIANGDAEVYTNPFISPSGFPFNVFQMDGTLSSEAVYNARERVCNSGYLVELYEDNGIVNTRCPAERIDDYVRKGGDRENAVGKGCLCNGLMPTIRLGSLGEPSILTTGSDLSVVKELLEVYGLDYPATDVLDYVFNGGLG